MKHSEQEKLLKEIVCGADLQVFREQSLANGLRAMRRHQHRRRLFRVAAIALIPALLGLTFLLMRAPKTDVAPTFTAPGILAASSSAVELDSGVKIINDDELLSLFPDRPVALIGSPGAQRLVFLEDASKITEDSRF